MGGGFTVIVKAGSEAVVLPSLTVMTMLACVAAVVGVPLSAPVDVLKLAHVGLLLMLKVSVSPSASFADGWKL